MQNNNFLIILNQNKILTYTILYFSLIVGFVFGENSTGGALIDYNNQRLAVDSFENNFTYSILNYEEFSTRHSPILIIILSLFQKIGFNDFFLRFTHLHVCLFLPIIFLKILNEKFGKEVNKVFIILSSLLFLSPTFRTLSIWPDSRLIGLIFFSLSILYYLKFQKNNNFYYCIFNILFCAISSYFSPNFSLFSIFYFFNFIKIYKIFSKKIFILLIFNILLSLPAIYYIFILDINFINKSAAIGFERGQNILFVNIFNNILLTFSLIFFYLIPFIYSRTIDYIKLFSYKKILATSLVFLLLTLNFDYNYEYSGGGAIFKFSNFFFNNNLIFFIFSFFSIFFIFTVFEYRVISNYILFILIILNNPQYTIYHKYFDPFLIIVFFSLFQFKLNLKSLSEFKNLIFIYLYFISFLIINNLRYLWTN